MRKETQLEKSEIKAFLGPGSKFEGKLFYVTSNDGEIPLKDQTEKIRKMLGADINND